MPIKIPQDGRFSLPNNSDKFGNIHYVKCMNFDEEGYIKLSPRSVSLVNEQDDTEFNIPVAFGRHASDRFDVTTVDNPFAVDLNETASTGLSAAIDGGASVPNTTFDSHGRWWQNRFYTTDTDDLFYHTALVGAWTDANVTLTAGKNHFIEVNAGNDNLLIANGNFVVQVNASHATELGQLEIPADYEIIGIKYSNDRAAVATRLSDSAAGQNQEAQLFIWNLTSNAADGFGVGSDAIMAVERYKSSYVILTRTGQLKYFNGAGFEELASLPFYFQNITWGDSQNPEMFGDVMKVDGDVIYINLGTSYERFGIKGEEYIPESPGGVYCYDPKVGLYHRYSPSTSEVSRLTVTSGNINTGTDVLTKTAGTIPATGNPIKYIHSRATKIGGLNTGQVYYVIKTAATTFKLALTKEDALNSVAIDITSVGAATNYFIAVDLTDYAPSFIGRTGGIGLSEKPTHSIGDILFGQELERVDSVSNTDSHLNFTINGFKNIGYLVTPKIFSDQIKDKFKKFYLLNRPLKTGDKITIKQKKEDILGLPVTTPQDSASCSWTSPREFSTTADLSEAKTYLDLGNGRELECEVISGAGAGQMSQIQSISEDSGTYSVVLEDELDGAASGRECNVLIDNWILYDTVTSTTDEGIKEVSLGTTSKWVKYKVICEGVDVTIENIQAVKALNKPAK